MVQMPTVIEGFCGMNCLFSKLVGYPGALVGDFNVTRFPSERSGEACMCQAMLEFFNFIYEQVLMDIPLVGGSFTWSSNSLTGTLPLGLELIDS
jgi:hypothetical protein